MKRVVIIAMLAWLAVGVCAGPARAAVDIHIGIPGVVIVPPSDHYDYPRYVYPYTVVSRILTGHHTARWYPMWPHTTAASTWYDSGECANYRCSSSSNALASCKSTVSPPSVNQP
jgi:hypothetical protein